MSEAGEVFVELDQAELFLEVYLGVKPLKVTQVGEGAWSRCFAFGAGDKDLVIRFGKYVEDFRKDEVAFAYNAPGLPVPEVLDIGQAYDGYYAVSTRAYGVPLESLSADQWRVVVPSIVDALEAMRAVNIPPSAGAGGWGVDEVASHASWPAYLLAVGEETPGQRGYGWRKKLAASSKGQTTFTWGYEILGQTASDAAPIRLIHGDLMNRNVLVSGDRISGVFDWGCSKYGDPLYELAWFEFWAPWTPDLDIGFLKAQLEQCWRQTGKFPLDYETRLLACYLHIGLEHLAYNASIGSQVNLEGTADRMRVLAAEFGF